MDTLKARPDGGAWRTLREAAGVLVRSPLGCVALGVAFLGIAGILRESAQFKKAESERVAWSAPGTQDLRDALRDESAVRRVVVAPRTRRASRAKAREQALRNEVATALAAALNDIKRR